MFVIFLSLLLFSALSGIIFPGRCPKTPPTQYTDYRNMFPEDTLNSYQRYEVIFNIPFFEDKTSYIFRAPNMALNTIILDQGNELCGIQLNPSMNGDFKIRTYANSTKSNSSITIKTTLNSVDDTVICDARSEEIWTWYEGIYVFVWSCVDRKDQSENDQALIIGAVQITSMLNPMDVSKERNQEVRTLANKYLSSDLIKLIDLTNIQFEMLHLSDTDLFACPRGFEIKKQKIRTMYAIITVLIVFAGVIGVVLWKNFCKAHL